MRQKPVSMEQLDLFGETFNERVLYVRSQKKRLSHVRCEVEESVFRSSSVDSSGECSSRTDERRIPPLK